MLDVITLQDRGRYKQDEYLQQAAHARLLDQLHAPVTRSASLGQLGSLVVATAVLLLALRPEAAPVEAALPVSVTTTTAASALAPTGGSGCWVTGDLAGDANPALIAARLCSK
jgi:hypothetical protein